MKKAQVEIVYLALTIAIAFLLSVGTFVFSKSVRENFNSQLAFAGLERTSIQVEAGFLKLKDILDNTNATNVTLKLPLPNKIGEQHYTISTNGSNTIELRTIGNPSISKSLTIKFWNVTIRGFVESSQGFMILDLQNTSSVLLK
jgi:hypothetical protein